MKYYCFGNKYPRAYQDLELFRTQIYRKKKKPLTFGWTSKRKQSVERAC